MNAFIRSLSNSFRQAHSGEMRTLLGLRYNEKLPVEGMPPRIIQGIKVWVTPLGPNPTKYKRSNHRVRAECPTCHRDISAGRLKQHNCKSMLNGGRDAE